MKWRNQMAELTEAKKKVLLDGFRKLITPQITDAMERLGLSDCARVATIGLKPLDPTLPTMAGIAVTVQEGPRRLGSPPERLDTNGSSSRQLKKDEVLVIAASGWQLDEDGMLPIPNAPGLGLNLDTDSVARYTDGGLKL